MPIGHQPLAEATRLPILARLPAGGKLPALSARASLKQREDCGGGRVGNKLPALSARASLKQ